MLGWERNFRNRSVDVHQFAMVPRADVPRSSFDRQFTHKTTFDAGYLVPVYVDEVLPGDTFSLRMTAFCRLATPLYPTMDNLTLDSFFFFVPNRLVWSNWKKFMGEQASPGDSISYTIPQMVSKASGYDVGSLHDYFGLPTLGQLEAGKTYSHSSLPLRCYNLIFQEWFRDENLQNAVTLDTGDGPDTYSNYALLRRGKRKDYFTGALPWPQKGNTAISAPLAGNANVYGDGSGTDFLMRDGHGVTTFLYSGAGGGGSAVLSGGAVTAGDHWKAGQVSDKYTGMVADLSSATGVTINALRLSFQTQKLLERDARGGTRYTEIIRSHFGVTSPDARLQRPEYLGGGSSSITISPVAQTSGTSASGTTTPLGNLAAVGTGLASGHGFTQSFTEHGHVIGLVSVRADLTYQQGVRRMWNRSTRYDFYFPAFAMLGEQAILQKEIYARGSGAAANDEAVFGYQERWAEMRYLPSMITSLFRSTASGTLDAWHLAQKFTSAPVLDTTFIQDTPPVSRIVAVGTGANGQQFLFDSFFSVRSARPMPMYSVPGLIDHF